MPKFRCDAKKLYAVIWQVTSSFGNGLVIKEALNYFRICQDEEPDNFYANLGIILLGILLHTPNMLSMLDSWQEEQDEHKNFLSFLKFILASIPSSALNAAGFMRACRLLSPSTPLLARIIGAVICLIISSPGEYKYFQRELNTKENAFSLWLMEFTNAYNHEDKSLYYCLQQSRRLFLWPILITVGNFLPGLFAGWELVTELGIENPMIYYSVGSIIGVLIAGLETNKAIANFYKNESTSFSKAAHTLVWPTAIIIYGLESSLALLMIDSLHELPLWMNIGYFAVVYATFGLSSAISYHKTVIEGVDANLSFKKNSSEKEALSETRPLLFDVIQKYKPPENRYSWWRKFCCCRPKNKEEYSLNDSVEEEYEPIKTRACNFFSRLLGC